MGKLDQTIYQLASQFQKRIGFRTEKAILGDENGRVAEPGQPGYVRVRRTVAGGFSEYLTVRLGIAINPINGMAVRLGYDADNQLAVVGVDFAGLEAQGTNSTTNNPADPNNSYYIQQMRLSTFVCHPISSAADSMLVAVQTGDVVDLDVDTITLFPGEQVDLTSYIPAGAGEWLIACIFWKDDNTLEVITSTAKTSPDDLGLDDINECMAGRTAGSLPIWAWRLYNGQTGIAAGAPADGGDDFMDLRPLFFMLQSGGGSGITQLTGDVTAGPGSGSQAATLANSGVSAGSYTNASVTFDAKGRATAASSGAAPAPANATYITQTADATLSAEQALSSLATGLMKVTTTTGVVSSITDSAGLAGAISDETGSGALVFGTSPTIATPTVSGENVTDFIDYAEASTPSTPASNHARVWVADDNGFTVPWYIDSTPLSKQIFRDGIVVCKNTSGGTITAGEVVRERTGSSVSMPVVDKAIATVTAVTFPPFGVALDTAANNGFLRVQTRGIVTPFDTSGFAAGSILYLSASSAGALTATAPVFGSVISQVIPIARALNSSASGTILLWNMVALPGNIPFAPINFGDGTSGTQDIIGFQNSFSGTLRWNSLSANRIWTLPDATDTLVGQNTSDGLANKKLQDSTVTFVDNGDNTKQIAFQASGIATGTTRIITMPDANVDLGNLSASTITSGTLSEARLPHKFAVIEEQQAQNTAGGGSTATTWSTRVLNTEVADADNLVTLSSNKFTPISGTYRITVNSPFLWNATTTGTGRLRLRNVTQTSVVFISNNFFANVTQGLNMTLTTQFTANGTDEYDIQYFIQQARATNGLGAALNEASNVERYTQVLLEKIA